VVDPERLHRLLRRVTDDLAVLRGYAAVEPGELLEDPARLGHVKYLFVTLLEGCIDAAQHVCASEGYGPPSTNADAMRTLARHGLLSRDEGETMAKAVGFRNLLVHGYAEIDDRRVVSYLTEIDRVAAFVRALARLV
jgi:uncharacterized protein YutE (UPF0331/DUF86 family)